MRQRPSFEMIMDDDGFTVQNIILHIRPEKKSRSQRFWDALNSKTALCLTMLMFAGTCCLAASDETERLDKTSAAMHKAAMNMRINGVQSSNSAQHVTYYKDVTVKADADVSAKTDLVKAKKDTSATIATLQPLETFILNSQSVAEPKKRNFFSRALHGFQHAVNSVLGIKCNEHNFDYIDTVNYTL